MKRVLLLSLLVLAACKKPASSSSPTNTGGAAPDPGQHAYDERQACTVDADCVPVEIECCDHCNGGKVVGVHRDHAADVSRSTSGAPECGGTACTKMACVEEPTGICRQNICGIKVGTLEEVPPLPER